MKMYAIVVVDEPYSMRLIEKICCYRSAKSAALYAQSMLQKHWHEPFSSTWNVDKYGNETVNFIDKDGVEICRVIGLEVSEDEGVA